MRESTALDSVRQVAVVAEDRVGEQSIPPSFDEVALYPYRPGELSAKLRLIEDANKAPDGERLVFGDVVIDVTGYEVTRGGVPVALTFKEQELLHFLATHPDRVFSRSQLLTEVWGYDYFGGTRTVDVHIRRVRFKLGDEIERRIHTIRNVGYKFVSQI
ncbi:MAG: DNA-binding response regulator [Actinobacteria bacterium]|jgi:DNA-binding response OmpR family regulator|nr:MAG: DNA-binding response regulator [Actinomycetota bacterium]